MSDLPLVPGSIRGRRFFSFTRDGRLDAPIHNGHYWNVGEETIAECAFKWDKDESHIMYNCTCGFYASLGEFDPSINEHGVPNEYIWAEVVGIIEGYGETLVGKKGFRCSKARILALAPSPGTKSRQDGDWLVRWLMPYTGSTRDYRLRDLKKAFPQVPIFKTAEQLFEAFPITDVKDLV